MQRLMIEATERAGVTDGLTLSAWSAWIDRRCGGEPTMASVLSALLEVRKSRPKRKAR
jgi:hypothetical protein